MKLTEEELKILQESQKNINENIFALGENMIAWHNLEEQSRMLGEKMSEVENKKAEILETLQKLTQNESEVLKSLESKYTKGTININTGEITPS